MRTYSGFLLLEDILDFLPNNNTSIVSFANDVISPVVLVPEADCLTKVGTQVNINYEIEGRVELATNEIITKTRIDTLLGQGIYKVSTRHSHSCTSTGGICQTCYAATFMTKPLPVVGSKVKVPAEYNYQTDVIIGDGLEDTFTLTETSTAYDYVHVIIDGTIQTTGYTITDATLVMSTAPLYNTTVVVRFYRITGQPFLGYLSDTYSGALLGMKPLPTQPLNIRPSLIHRSLSDDKIGSVKRELQSTYKLIPPSYFEYVDKIPDKLERSLYLVVLYGIYANVNS
jgi:hypothetical protein